MASEYISLFDLDKEYLLKKSKTFCMFPWLHLNVTPKGNIYPCCSNDYTNPIANTETSTLKEAFNSDYMKQLRVNMLKDVKSPICTFCYDHEKASPHSFRTYSIDNYGKYFDDSMFMTHEDGEVDEFKMRYFDIRFSNICNFKCRSCGTEFSSQWAIEDKKTWNPDGPVIIHVDNHKGNVLSEVLEHVEHIDLAYFAGGEPLITEEHYLVLEELIRKGRTDTVLRYNTNASTVSYKQYDIFDLWKHFNRIELSCSIDHYGERAEIMRHGTDWGRVERNLKKFRSLDYISFQINTVFSIMNFLTITEFYEYMHSAGLLDYKNDWWNSLYLAANPRYYSAQAMPAPMKEIATEKVMSRFKEQYCTDLICRQAAEFANLDNTWDSVKAEFFHNVERLDEIRGEKFFDVFTELQPLRDTYR